MIQSSGLGPAMSWPAALRVWSERHLLPGSRAGVQVRGASSIVTDVHDGLFHAPSTQLAMGGGTEKYRPTLASSASPRSRAGELYDMRGSPAIQRTGCFRTRTSRWRVPSAGGDPVVFDTDEGVQTPLPSRWGGGRRSTRRATSPPATPQILDGAAAVIVVSKAVERLGATPLGEIVGYGQVAGPGPVVLTQPPGHQPALEQADKPVSDVALFELNEAFAAVGLASMQDLGIEADVVNVNGGAIALGHPVGVSGTRVALTLLHELKRRGGGLGAAALCGGGARATPSCCRSRAPGPSSREVGQHPLDGLESSSSDTVASPTAKVRAASVRAPKTTRLSTSTRARSMRPASAIACTPASASWRAPSPGRSGTTREPEDARGVAERDLAVVRATEEREQGSGNRPRSGPHRPPPRARLR